MVKNKPKPFTLRVPVLHSKGTDLKPDFLLVIKDGVTKRACLDDTADLYKLIGQVEWYLEDLKDMLWAQNKKQAKK